MFSGIGGLCEGVKLAGFRVTGANERDKYAVPGYRHNFPNTPLFAGDVQDWFPEDELVRNNHIETYVGDETVDLIFGGPPCQGYSQIGPRDVADPRNEMYLHVCRLAQILNPKYILIENVPNMLLMKKGLFKDRIAKALRDIGYDNIGIRVVDASLYGVPQKRRRVFIIAARSTYLSTDMGSIFDETLTALKRPVSTVSDAISDLPGEVSSGVEHVLPYPEPSDDLTWYQREMRLDFDGEFWSSEAKRTRRTGESVEELFSHHTKDIQERRLSLIKLLKPGKKADSLPKHVWNNARPEKWRRFHPDWPAHTLLAQMHRDLSEWVHPHYHRWITVREALRLQGFHDGFVLQSSEWQQLKQVGNAVPPLLGRVPAMAIRLAESKASAEERPFAQRGQLGLFAASSRAAK